MTVEEQLSEFMINNPAITVLGVGRNRWLEDETLKVYVRRSIRFLNDCRYNMLDVANIAASPPGQGRFTKFLDYAERMRPYQGIFIESVINRRLAEFLDNRRYTEQINNGQTLAEQTLVSNFYILWD
jgi:hypothetical protein